MAVYTPLSAPQLKQLIAAYPIGQVIGFTGIADGIDNTNYYVDTSSGHYILTIFEQYSTLDVQYFLHLLQFFQHGELPVPMPVQSSDNQQFKLWHNKVYALFHRLPGKSVQQTQSIHCRQIGNALGQLHRFGQAYTNARSNPWGFSQIQHIGQQQLSNLPAGDADLLSDELNFQQQQNYQQLPSGVIHADLFTDNALFTDQQLSGIIDFYSVCRAPLLFDLAITVNSWCLDGNHYLDSSKVSSLIHAYQQQRSLTSAEQQYWPAILRAAALRFWLSRLLFQHSRQNAQLTLDKDPNVLKCLLIKHRENMSFCQALIA